VNPYRRLKDDFDLHQNEGLSGAWIDAAVHSFGIVRRR